MSTKKEPKELAKQFYTVMYRMRRFEEEVFEFYKRGLMPGLAHLYLGEEAVAAGIEDILVGTNRAKSAPPPAATATWWPEAPIWTG